MTIVSNVRGVHVQLPNFRGGQGFAPLFLTLSLTPKYLCISSFLQHSPVHQNTISLSTSLADSVITNVIGSSKKSLTEGQYKL